MNMTLSPITALSRVRRLDIRISISLLLLLATMNFLTSNGILAGITGPSPRVGIRRSSLPSFLENESTEFCQNMVRRPARRGLGVSAVLDSY